MPSNLYPLGVWADSGERLSTIDPAALEARAAAPDPPAMAQAVAGKLEHAGGHLGVDDSVSNPNSLNQTGWAVLYGTSVSDGIKRRLEPLIDRRRRQVGNDALFKIFEGKNSYQTGQSLDDWLLDKGPGGCAIPNRDVKPKAGVPYYVLVVADPKEIPFEFQFDLDLNWAVGRIWFDNEEEFGRYAESVVAYETGKSVPNSREMVIFSPRNGQDSAMNLLCDKLANPMLQATPTDPPFGQDQGFRPRSFIGDAATRETLETILNGKTPARRPAVLFTGSHGMAFYSGDERQAKQQGAICCQDWKGVGSPQRHMYYAGEDTGDARVHGMIHVMFDCFGAGFPKHDTYSRLKDRHPIVAPSPMVSHLPQSLLAHPEGGALAVLGHVDRAWSTSYESKKAGSQIEDFRSVMNRIMSGHRVGNATDRFNQRWAVLSTGLDEAIQNWADGFADADALQDLWIARDDARNYIVFGDPAVCLRVDDLQ